MQEQRVGVGERSKLLAGVLEVWLRSRKKIEPRPCKVRIFFTIKEPLNKWANIILDQQFQELKLIGTCCFSEPKMIIRLKIVLELKVL